MVVTTGFKSEKQRKAVMAKLGGGKITMGMPMNGHGKVEYAIPTKQGMFINSSKTRVVQFALHHGYDPEDIMVITKKRRRKNAEKKKET